MDVYKPKKESPILDDKTLEALRKVLEQEDFKRILKDLENLTPLVPVPPLQPPASTLPPAMPGWICPVCGRGNAPYTNTCPCIPIVHEMTC